MFYQAKKGAFLIDSSTVDPSVAQEISAQAEPKGILFVDAPVSGGDYILSSFHQFKIVIIYSCRCRWS